MIRTPIAGLMLILSSTAAATLTADYTVTLDPSLRQIEVGACFDPAIPSNLHAHEQLQQQLSGRFYVDGQRQRPRFSRDRLRIAGGARCLRYSVTLDQGTGDRRWGGTYAVGGDIVTKPEHWLLQPRQPVDDGDLRLRFDLPADINVSAPWPQSTNTNGEVEYRIGRTPSTWDAQVAFGRFEVERLTVGDGVLRLAILNSEPPVDIEDTRRWVREAAAATLAVHGHFPQPEPQTLVVPVGRQREAVPFARVLRGGGVAVQFYIDPTRPLREFSSDWTATHEFSHLLLPYVSRRDAWLSEGLASYMQNVLRARDGRLSEQQAWSKLNAGFDRGKRGTRRSNSGGNESNRGSWRNNTMRIYWGGAAIWFLADVELRRRSNGQLSVDTALAGIHNCCMNPGRMWSARDLMAELDRITGEDVFMDLYYRHHDLQHFPDVDSSLSRLGIKTRSNSIRMNDSMPESKLRQQIMQP
ncbi:MAG: hypothetical protein Tsb002_30560 [Wenzhouxiangellaceae bacterium]